MKAHFYLTVILMDARNAVEEFCERVTLSHETEINFVPNNGMSVRIGRDDEGPSEHTVESVIWVEKKNCLYIWVDNYETTIDHGETDARGWEYYDGLIKEYIEKDGWEVIEVESIRKNIGWRE